MNTPVRPRRGATTSRAGWRGLRRSVHGGAHGGAPAGALGVVLTAPAGAVAATADALDALAAVADRIDEPVEVVLVPWGPAPGGGLGPWSELVARAPLPTLLGPLQETGNAARTTGAGLVATTYVVLLDPGTRLRADVLRAMLHTGRTGEHDVVRAVGDPGHPVGPLHPAGYLLRTEHLLDGHAHHGFEETHGDHPEATFARALSAPHARVEGRSWEPAVDRWVPRAEVAPRWAERIEPWLRMVPAVRLLVPEPERTRWIHELLVGDLPGLLADVERLPYELLPEVADVVGAVLAALAPADLARVPVEARAAAWLGGQARWDDLAALTAARAGSEGQFPTRVRRNDVEAVLPGVDWSQLHPPAAMLRVGADESRLETVVRRVRWSDADQGPDPDDGPLLSVDVFALVGHLDLTGATVQARWVGPGDPVPAHVRPRRDPALAEVSGLRDADQSHGSVTVLTTCDALGPGRWLLEVAVRREGVVRAGRATARDASGSAGALPVSPDGRVRPEWGPDGLALHVGPPGTHPRPVPRSPEVVRLAAEDGYLAVTVEGRLRDAPVLESDRARIEGMVDGRTVRFSLTSHELGLPEHPAPCGRYRLRAGGRDLPWSAGAEEQVGFGLPGEHHRVRAARTDDGGVLLELAPPLHDDELGELGQARARAAYDVGEALDDVVLLESQSGRACADSPLAVDRELARVAPGLERVWVVAERAVLVPDGASSVLRHSREWHRLLATARRVVTDGPLPDFFVRRPGQVVLQTLGDRPVRPVGRELWHLQDRSPRWIEDRLRRTSGQWSAVLASSTRLEERLQESFGLRGSTVLCVGLPRTDLLLADDADDRGRAVRRRLDIDPDQLVVLYAPLPGAPPALDPGPRDLLDVGDLAAELGPGCTLLVRGPVDGPAAVPAARRGARVLDVTHYPEVSELMLASDAGLFDYSTLRFDYALLQRPMVFQVPDPTVRAGGVGPSSVPYAETAPGPVVTTAAEVADALGDLAALARRTAPALAVLNARFNDLADGRAARRVVAELLGTRLRDAALTGGAPLAPPVVAPPVVDAHPPRPTHPSRPPAPRRAAPSAPSRPPFRSGR